MHLEQQRVVVGFAVLDVHQHAGAVIQFADNLTPWVNDQAVAKSLAATEVRAGLRRSEHNALAKRS